MVVDVLLTVAQILVFLYDVLSYPFYRAASKALGQVATKSTTPEAYLVKESSEEISWRRDKSNDNKPYKEIIIDNKVDTVTKGFNFAVAKYGSKRCMGTREVLGEMDEVQENG